MKGLTMREKYKVLMAKTSADCEEVWLPLWMHLRDTAGVMKKLVRTWVPDAVCVATGLDQELFSKTAIFLAAIHDIGKATSYFQGIITQSCPEKYNEIISEGFEVHKEYRAAGKTPHAHAGQWILQSDTINLEVHESLAMVVGAHHGKPISIDVLTGEPDLLKVHPINFYGVEDNNEKIFIWKETWHNILEEALNLAGIGSIDQLPILSSEAQILFSGLVIIADWIASNTKYFPLIALDEYGNDTLYPKRVNDGWNSLNFPKCQNYGMNRIDEEIFKERFGFSPNKIQRCMLDVVNNIENPGIFILEAQMGVGKTEAALSAAEVIASRKKEGGIFFGLPTQATSNGLFKRLYNWGEKVSDQVLNSICLAHAAAEFNEEYNQLIIKGKTAVDEDNQEGITVHPWFQGNKRALLADFVIGTIDQFLMASLRRKHFMLRHIGLAGKVVIIDECHAYDAYMNEYLERSLQWMAAYGVPVILLSATLLFERRRTLIECYAKAYSKYYRKKRKQEIICEQTDWSTNTNYPLFTWTDGETIKQTVIEQKIEDKVIKINHFYSPLTISSNSSASLVFPKTPYTFENTITPIFVCPVTRCNKCFSIRSINTSITFDICVFSHRICNASSVTVQERICFARAASPPASNTQHAKISILASAILEWVFIIPAPSFTSFPIWPTKRIRWNPSSHALSNVCPIKLLHFTHCSGLGK